jgi:hypothetical protein
MYFTNPLVSDAGEMWVADEEELKKMVDMLKQKSRPSN